MPVQDESNSTTRGIQKLRWDVSLKWMYYKIKMAATRSLYEVLGLEKAASHTDIRKAYLKLAVQLHPDKNPDDAGAKDKFQTLSSVYAVLGNEDRRRLYDETGIAQDMDQPPSESAFDDLYEYYRSMYAKVTEDDIAAFEESYRGSAEEKADVLRYYDEFGGDMDKVFAWVMCSDPALDSHRFADAISEELQSRGVAPSKRFRSWEQHIRKRKPPANPLGLRKSKKKGKENRLGDDHGALVSLIRKNQQDRAGSFLDRLANKYGAAKGPCTSEPSEEEFLATARRSQKAKSKGRPRV